MFLTGLDNDPTRFHRTNAVVCISIFLTWQLSKFSWQLFFHSVFQRRSQTNIWTLILTLTYSLKAVTGAFLQQQWKHIHRKPVMDFASLPGAAESMKRQPIPPAGDNLSPYKLVIVSVWSIAVIWLPWCRPRSDPSSSSVSSSTTKKPFKKQHQKAFV